MTDRVPDPGELRDSALAGISSRYQLSGQQLAAVGRSYDVTSRHIAPFITAVASDMLDDLRREQAADPDRRVVFLGRDGTSFGLVVRELDPSFHAAHCVDITVSRSLLEAAVKDREEHGEEFPQLAPYRGEWLSRGAGQEQTSGTFRDLTDYLNRHGVPVARGSVVLVDSSFKGTSQEMLQALYPTTRFTGKYLAHAAAAGDPNPGTKRGYEVHVVGPEAAAAHGVVTLPSDERLTFVSTQAVCSIEYTLNGPLSSPTGFREGAPVQEPQRHDPDPLHRIDPARLDPAFRDPLVREASRAANLLAVSHYARETAHLRDAGGNWRRKLELGRTRYVQSLRAWLQGSPADPEFARVMDSFVIRPVTRKAADAAHSGRLRAASFPRAAVAEPTSLPPTRPWRLRPAVGQARAERPGQTTEGRDG